MRRLLIMGNWKMHGDRVFTESLLMRLSQQAVPEVDWVVFPPAIWLPLCGPSLQASAIAWGAQNMNDHDQGAYTGEISASMLCDCGCRYVLVGHSERRQLFHETDIEVRDKVVAAIKAGLVPVLCVGETLSQRQQGLTLEIIQEQLAVALSLEDNPLLSAEVVVAYEPIWAIGTGQTATADQAQTVHAAIRAQLSQCDSAWAGRTRIVYGGSVKPDNSAQLLGMPDIDGALVGGASLQIDSFLSIGQSCLKSL